MTQSGRESTKPINTAGMSFFEITNISVNEWHPLPDGQGPPTQVHLLCQLAGVSHAMVMRFRSPKAVDELIVALITHRRSVWGGPINGSAT